MPHQPLYKIAYNKKPSSLASTKRTVKFLGSCSDPRVQRIILKSANDSVYRSICNAFFNLAENPEISINPKHRKLLKSYNPRIKKLISPQVPVRKKRKIIQKGGAAFLGSILPLVLSTALSFLGSQFLAKQGK